MMPSPLLCMKTFNARVFLKKTKVPPRNFSTLLDKNVFQRRIVISTLYAKNLSITEFFWNIEWFHNKAFLHNDSKNVSTETGYILFFCIKLYDTRIFLKHWIVPPWIFSALWDSKKNQRKTVRSTSYTWKFSIPIVFWVIEGLPCDFFGTVRHSIKSWYLYYPIEILTAKLFWKTRLHRRNFSAQWDKIFSAETRDTPLINKKLSVPKIF